MDINEKLAAMNARIRREDVNYGVTALPIFLCLDASGSMEGQRIKSVNDGVIGFIRSGSANEDAQDSLMLDIVVFNGDGVREVQPLTNIKKVIFEPLSAAGGTPFGEALKVTLDLMERFLDRKQKSYKPYLVVMSDGAPTDSRKEVDRQIARARRLQEEGQIKVRCVGIGADADQDTLRRITIRGKVDCCGDLDITNFFEWLSSMAVEQSMRSLSDQDEDLF